MLIHCIMNTAPILSIKPAFWSDIDMEKPWYWNVLHKEPDAKAYVIIIERVPEQVLLHGLDCHKIYINYLLVCILLHKL